MEIEGPGQAITAYIGEGDHWHGKPLVNALVERLRGEGFAGVTVTRGLLGFGAHSHIHSANILQLSQDLPLVLTLVDTEPRATLALAIFEEMISEGLITVHEVKIVKYRHGETQV
jgi:PII-like signaling protein